MTSTQPWAIYFIGLILVLGLTVGCGDDSSSDTTDDTSTDDTAPENGGQEGGAEKWDPAKGTATISGSVKFEGKAPKRRPVGMSGDPKCLALHDKAPLSETTIVNDNGTLQNVIVYVKKGVSKWKFDTPKTAASLNQQGCMYIPHVQVIQTGQELVITNSDDLLHNVHSLAKKNKGFNFSQAKAGDKRTEKMRIPEMPVKIKCDVHGWMNTYIGVLKHPFHDVTGAKGSYELPKLPAGEYVIVAWHEKYGTQEETITVGDGESKTVDFTFKK